MSKRRIEAVAPLILIGLLCVPAVLAQSPTEPASQISNNGPADALGLAEKRNTLEQDGGQPWHLKATYEIFSEDGLSKDTGTYEEWWASAKRNKHTVATKDFTRTDYFTDEGVFRVETGKMSAFIGPNWINALVHPFTEEDFDSFTTEAREHEIDKMPLNCITLAWRKGMPVEPITHTYCFGPELILRAAISEYGLFQILYNHHVRLAERYVPKEIRVLAGSRSVANIYVEKCESLNDMKDPKFTPPVGAKKLPSYSTGYGVTGGTPDQQLVRRTQPESAAPGKAGVHGEVAIKVTIDKDGRVTNPQVVSGSPTLTQTAMDTVTQWRYRPWVANHEPIDVETTLILGCSKEKKAETITCQYLKWSGLMMPMLPKREAFPGVARVP